MHPRKCGEVILSFPIKDLIPIKWGVSRNNTCDACCHTVKLSRRIEEWVEKMRASYMVAPGDPSKRTGNPADKSSLIPRIQLIDQMKANS